MTEGVQLGTLEATVSPAAFLGGFNSAISVLDIPYLMPADSAKAQALREGPLEMHYWIVLAVKVSLA